MTLDSSWREMVYSIPPPDVPVLLARREWAEARVVNVDEIPMWFNACGLFWKLTGIAKEALGESYEPVDLQSGWAQALSR